MDGRHLTEGLARGLQEIGQRPQPTVRACESLRRRSKVADRQRVKAARGIPDQRVPGMASHLGQIKSLGREPRPENLEIDQRIHRQSEIVNAVDRGEQVVDVTDMITHR